MTDQITIRDVYDAQQRTDGKVDTVSVQVAAFTARVEQRLDHGQGKLDDHETRLRDLKDSKASQEQVDKLEGRVRVLEAARWKITGICVTVAVVAGGGAGWVALAVTHH